MEQEDVNMGDVKKHCPTCGRNLSRSHFHRDRRRWDGLVWECKDCRRAKALAYFHAHEEEIKEDRKAATAERRGQDYEPGMTFPPGPPPLLPDVIDESLSLTKAAKRYNVSTKTIQRYRAKRKENAAEDA
nr:helix-turn-helix domain-containing protein [uncultured Rhodopila sp.]